MGRFQFVAVAERTVWSYFAYRHLREDVTDRQRRKETAEEEDEDSASNSRTTLCLQTQVLRLQRTRATSTGQLLEF